MQHGCVPSTTYANCLYRDHVFFFSYTQPQQKGGLLGMWSDADALAKVNCTYSITPLFYAMTLTGLTADLISNFTQGLRLAGLTPRRFLLQTGAKHYGTILIGRSPPRPRHLLTHLRFCPQASTLDQRLVHHSKPMLESCSRTTSTTHKKTSFPDTAPRTESDGTSFDPATSLVLCGIISSTTWSVSPSTHRSRRISSSHWRFPGTTWRGTARCANRQR